LSAITVLLAEQQISEHIRESRRPLTDWYVGIAEDPEERLFTEHNVPKENYWWIHRELGSRVDAGEVEKFFLSKGAQGGGGGGTDESVFVYAYVVGPNTKESV
jgi:hypothetical protein